MQTLIITDEPRLEVRYDKELIFIYDAKNEICSIEIIPSELENLIDGLLRVKRELKCGSDRGLAKRILARDLYNLSHTTKVALIKAIRLEDDELGLREAKDKIEQLFDFDGEKATLKEAYK